MQPTVLLGENLLDVGVAVSFSLTYMAARGWGRLPLNYRARMGGGGTTAVQYEAIQKDGATLCLCMVDSDRASPKGRLGSTAEAIINVDDPTKPW